MVTGIHEHCFLKTISEFRTNNRPALKKVLKQCARLCMKLGLIDGNVLFLDSSKIRANAWRDKTWTPEKCEKYLEKLDEKIEELLCACEIIDDKEKDSDLSNPYNRIFIEKDVFQERAKTRFAPTMARKSVSDVGANLVFARIFGKIRIDV